MSADRIIRGKPIVAIALLTADDLKLLGSAFDRAWPVDDAPCFKELLQAIDEADRATSAERVGSGGRTKPEDA